MKAYAAQSLFKEMKSYYQVVLIENSLARPTSDPTTRNNLYSYDHASSCRVFKGPSVHPSTFSTFCPGIQYLCSGTQLRPLFLYQLYQL